MTKPLIAAAHGTRSAAGLGTIHRLIDLVRDSRPGGEVDLCFLDVLAPRLRHRLESADGPAVRACRGGWTRSRRRRPARSRRLPRHVVRTRRAVAGRRRQRTSRWPPRDRAARPAALRRRASLTPPGPTYVSLIMTRRKGQG